MLRTGRIKERASGLDVVPELAQDDPAVVTGGAEERARVERARDFIIAQRDIERRSGAGVTAGRAALLHDERTPEAGGGAQRGVAGGELLEHHGVEALCFAEALVLE